ncbi:MAG: hypothetical protein A3C56_06070 [Ignavibacteria bacterium RIFCSPHIGHO2_02_FULL_56_12]|nr:MAG: hypothetical protein A3C56_06070 [Ignavibacteria bacterium RIFCSPHIGHO2_02_FULL_56_12]
MNYGESFAEMYGADLVLLHVVDEAPLLAFHTMELTADFVLEDTTQQAERRLDQFVKQHDIRNRYGLTLVVRRGSPAVEISKYAKEASADLIVMATHGRSGLSHVVLGSVAEKTVQLSDVPVLTIKPLKFKHGHAIAGYSEEQFHDH